MLVFKSGNDKGNPGGGAGQFRWTSQFNQNIDKMKFFGNMSLRAVRITTEDGSKTAIFGATAGPPSKVGKMKLSNNITNVKVRTSNLCIEEMIFYEGSVVLSELKPRHDGAYKSYELGINERIIGVYGEA